MAVRVAQSRGAKLQKDGTEYVWESIPAGRANRAFKDCAKAMGYRDVVEFVSSQDDPVAFRARMRERL